MLEERPYQRKQLIVDRPYQIRFVTRVFLLIFAIATISSAVAMWLLWQTTYRPELGGQTPVMTAAFIGIGMFLFLELLISIPLAWLLGIRYTHSVVGPMNRLKQTLQAISKGDFSQRILIRKGDALMEMAKAVNEMAESLGKRFPTSPRS